MSKLKNIIRHWLPIAAATAGLCFLAYASTQQVLRQTANDPQIQMAHDAADALAAGGSVNSVMPADAVDLSKSLAPFMIVYDSSKNLVASSGQLHGQPPALPSGVLDYTRQHGEDRVTWSPDPPAVRVAAVVVSYGGSSPGFVLAARSLRETEVRESQMLQFAELAGIITLVVTFIAVAFGEYVLGEGKG